MKKIQTKKQKKFASFKNFLIKIIKKTNIHRVVFIGIIVFLLVAFWGVCQYTFLSAQGFIKIFPQTVEGNFENIGGVLFLSNSEASSIRSFNQNNSSFPFAFMKDNIYSFEIIKEEPAREQEDILPKNTVANEEKIDEQLASPTTTIAAEEESQEQVEEILEKSTEANIEEEDKEILKEATTQLDAPEEVIEEAEHKEEPAKEQEVTSFWKNKIKTFAQNSVNNVLKKNPVFSLMANIAEQISEPSNIEAEIAKSIIISNFLVPELLEDEMSTQFVNQPKAKKEILNIKLGMSFANQASVSSDSILIVEIFHKNEWRVLEKIKLNRNISNAVFGAYYYIGLGNINSVEDLDELKVKISYNKKGVDLEERFYFDSAWLEIAVNSYVENIINNNVSEVENEIFAEYEKFYDFGNTISIRIPKSQVKTVNIFKEDYTVPENIVRPDIGQSPASGASEKVEETVKVENGSSSVETSNNKPSKDNIATDEHLKDGIDADVNNELLEGEVTDGSNEEVFSGEDFEVQPVSPPEAVEKIVEPITDPSSDPVSSPETVSEPAPSSDPVSSPEPTASIIIKKIAKQFESIKRRLVATVSLLTGTEEKIASEESATAEEEITTTTISTETTTTTIVTTTKETMPSTTTTLSEDYENILKEDAEDPGVLSSTTTTKDGNIISNVRHFGVENPELIIRQETQPLSNFKIRGAILKSPDRRAFRSNVEIDELKDEYIINIKHGPELIPGKYDLVIKYNNKKELYNNTISFVWGGTKTREMEISENTKVYFTTDAKEKNRIYIQVRIGENNFYNINGPDVKIPENTAVGVLENNFMFIDEASNLQGIDIVSNSFFSQVLDHSKDNYFTSEHKKYLIKIENDNILFLEENK